MPSAPDTSRKPMSQLNRGEPGCRYSRSAQQVVFCPRLIAPGTGAADLECPTGMGL
jgi:hypothetical protein